MNLVIRDPEAMFAIRPVEAALYLRAKKWSRIDLQANRSSTWRLPAEDGDEFEVLLPMETDLRDYPLRIGDMLSVLAVAERRSAWDIYNDILLAACDVTRIRIADPESNDGTLPIEQHAQIAQKARDLMLAAACAATEQRPVWSTKKPQRATEQIRKIRIGQTERGSYIVPVITRIDPELQLHGTNPDMEEPYERTVTRMLATSLASLDRAAEQAAVTQDSAAFEQAVADGVNANLCEAIVGLWGSDEGQRTLEFTFSWSPARPPATPLPKHIRFTADQVPLIRQGGAFLRAKAPVEEFEFVGVVVELKREKSSPTGSATIFQEKGKTPRRLTIELNDSDYKNAVAAHEERQLVRAVGRLESEGRKYVLRNARNFERVGSEQ